MSKPSFKQRSDSVFSDIKTPSMHVLSYNNSITDDFQKRRGFTAAQSISIYSQP